MWFFFPSNDTIMKARRKAEIAIRTAQTDDICALTEMAQLAYRQHFSYLWTAEGLEQYLAQAYQPSLFEKTIRDEHTTIWLALQQSDICGYLMYHRQKRLPGFDMAGGYINRIYLLEHCSGLGIGSRLLQQAAGQGLEDEVPYLWLEVMQSNKSSIAFYQKHGFDLRGATAFTQLPMRTPALSKMCWMVRPL